MALGVIRAMGSGRNNSSEDLFAPVLVPFATFLCGCGVFKRGVRLATGKHINCCSSVLLLLSSCMMMMMMMQ